LIVAGGVAMVGVSSLMSSSGAGTKPILTVIGCVLGSLSLCPLLHVRIRARVEADARQLWCRSW
jgi:hypothetical protein